MNSQIYNTTPAHSLYILYETLSNEMQQLFLQELITYQSEKIDDLMLYLALNKTKQENDFLTDSEAQTFIESLPLMHKTFIL